MTSDLSDRLGFSFLYFTPHVQVEHESWFARLRAHGYRCAELPIVSATDAELDWMRESCVREGLARTAVGFAVPGANPISADRVEREAAIEHLCRLCEKAQALGAELLAGPMHSAYGVWSEAPPTEEEASRCVEVLQRVGEHAALCGVRLALEPLNRFEAYFLNTAEQCLDLVRRIGHPAVTTAIDTHHAHIEESDPVAAIRASAGALGHVQLSENDRGTPGRGQVDFPRILQALEEIGYDGWLVVEAFSRQDADFGSMLRIWRSLDEGPEAVLAAGRRLVDPDA